MRTCMFGRGAVFACREQCLEQRSLWYADDQQSRVQRGREGGGESVMHTCICGRRLGSGRGMNMGGGRGELYTPPVNRLANGARTEPCRKGGNGWRVNVRYC